MTEDRDIRKWSECCFAPMVSGGVQCEACGSDGKEFEEEENDYTRVVQYFLVKPSPATRDERIEALAWWIDRAIRCALARVARGGQQRHVDRPQGIDVGIQGDGGDGGGSVRRRRGSRQGAGGVRREDEGDDLQVACG